MIWIIKNLLSHRNLTPIDKTPCPKKGRAIVERQARERMSAGINQYSPVENLPQADTSKTRDKLTKSIGASENKFF